MRQSKSSDETVARFIKDFYQDEKAHRVFAQKADTRYKAYRAILDRRMDASQWQSKNHPPYVFQIIETMTSGLLDPNPKWRLRPLPRMASPSEVEMYREGIKANELLLDYQLACDHFVEKQRPFALQALITGLTVGKTYWQFSEGIQHSQQMIPHNLMDDDGNIVATTETLGHVEVLTTLEDEPTFEVVDVRDFIWHEAAVSLERADRVTHRLWFTASELKRMVQGKRFNKVSNVSAIEDLPSDSSYGESSREQSLFEVNRTRDMIEVLEMWVENGRRRVTIANRTLLLDDRPNPFWHGQFPFVVSSGTPDLFRIPGISDVELINEIQEMMWTLQNQRLDAVQLLNNPVVNFRSDFDDPDSFDVYPGARNIVDDPSQVVMWSPEFMDTRSIEHENLLKEDLQAIPGASPALLGQIMQSGTTATEASLSSTLAMRRLANKKMHIAMGYSRFGEQWISLNQQFITEDRIVPKIGDRGAIAFETISPLLIQGKYAIQVEQLDESQIRSQRTAEASSRLQIALSAAPVLAALSQSGSAKMLNMDEFVKDYLKSFDINDTDRYFTEAKPQVPGTPQQQPSQPGVSAPQATDINAPSNAFSQSPVAMEQQQAAMTGGISNG